MKLYNDDSRCDGKTVKAENPLHQECDDCARRIAPRPEYVWMMGAPEFVNGKCDMRIENEN